MTRVIDRDTIEVEAGDGSKDMIRLLGVDTPEIAGPNKPNEYGDITDTACLDDWGIRAKEFTTEKLEGRMATLVIDGSTFVELFTFGRFTCLCRHGWRRLQWDVARTRVGQGLH